jgi:hypothetical protein
MRWAVVCRNTKTHGGGFGLVWASVEAGCAHHGPRHTLKCENFKRGKGGCGWYIKVEDFEEGLAAYAMSADEHNHALAQSVAVANASHAMRHIKEEDLVMAKKMVASGVFVADAYRFLQALAMERGEEPTFTYQDVYHATGASAHQRALDASGFVEELLRREHLTGLFQRVKTDPHGCLSHAFFELPDAKAIYSANPKDNVVLLDSKVRTFHRVARESVWPNRCPAWPCRRPLRRWGCRPWAQHRSRVAAAASSAFASPCLLPAAA